MERTQSFRSSEQLFICYGTSLLPITVSKQRLEQWIPPPLSELGRAVPPRSKSTFHLERSLFLELARSASLTDIVEVQAGGDT